MGFLFTTRCSGISATYATVGGMFLALAGMNGLLLHETKNFTPSAAATLPPQAISTTSSNSNSSSNTVLSGPTERATATIPATPQESNWTGVVNSFHEAFAAWKLLLNDPNTQIRNTVRMNGMFWFTVSGTQMTLLPLLMVGPRALDATSAANAGLAMSAAEIGGCFAFMSLVSFVSAQPMAYLADKYGKVPTILGGCGLLSCSMLALPLTTSAHAASFALPVLPLLPVLPDYTPVLVAVLLPFALGNTALNATPTALMADLTEPAVRAQALSLLRTSGDLGLLLGKLRHYCAVIVYCNVYSCCIFFIIILL